MENEKQNEMADFEDGNELDQENIDNQSTEEVKQTTEADKAEPEKSQMEEDERAKQKEQNRLAAERRKREKAEREEALEKKGYNKAIRETLNDVNPYTNSAIKDDVDLEIYLTMKELEKQGKDPVTDYASYVAEKTRKSRQEEQAQKELNDYAQNDFNSFVEKHPDIDVKKLMSDEQFNKFADGKFGKVPLNKIYEDFIDFTSFYEKKTEETAQERAINKFARMQSSIGSMDNVPKTPKKSFMEMSTEEFDAEYKRLLGKERR